jgi:hypothetical protein
MESSSCEQTDLLPYIYHRGQKMKCWSLLYWSLLVPSVHWQSRASLKHLNNHQHSQMLEKHNAITDRQYWPSNTSDGTGHANICRRQQISASRGASWPPALERLNARPSNLQLAACSLHATGDSFSIIYFNIQIQANCATIYNTIFFPSQLGSLFLQQP